MVHRKVSIHCTLYLELTCKCHVVQCVMIPFLFCFIVYTCICNYIYQISYTPEEMKRLHRRASHSKGGSSSLTGSLEAVFSSSSSTTVDSHLKSSTMDSRDRVHINTSGCSTFSYTTNRSVRRHVWALCVQKPILYLWVFPYYSLSAFHLLVVCLSLSIFLPLLSVLFHHCDSIYHRLWICQEVVRTLLIQLRVECGQKWYFCVCFRVAGRDKRGQRARSVDADQWVHSIFNWRATTVYSTKVKYSVCCLLQVIIDSCNLWMCVKGKDSERLCNILTYIR